MPTLEHDQYGEPSPAHSLIQGQLEEFRKLWDSFHPYSETMLIEHFAGALFEVASYEMKFREMAPEGITVLSPDETFQIVRQFYLHNKVFHFPFGLHAIEGTWLPDGFIIDPNAAGSVLQGVCEYTLTSQHDKIREVYRRFRALQHADGQGIEPYIGPQTDLHYVVPRNLDFPEDLAAEEHVKVSYAPISTTEFGRYVHKMVHSMGPRWDPHESEDY